MCSLLGLAAFISALRGDTEVADPLLTLDDIPQGISARHLQGERVFLKRTGDKVEGFLAAVPDWGMPLIWCPAEQIFFGVGHGEIFDKDGRAIDGPAVRGMDRFEVTVQDPTALSFDTSDVTFGGPKVPYDDRTNFVNPKALEAVLNLPNSNACAASVRPPT